MPDRDVAVIVGSKDTCNNFLSPGDAWKPDPQRGWPFMLPAGHIFKCAAEKWKGPGSNLPRPLMTVTSDRSFNCRTLLQGPWRKKRAQLYRQYLREFYGKHDVWAWDEVPGVGHSDEDMFSSPQFRKALHREQGQVS